MERIHRGKHKGKPRTKDLFQGWGKGNLSISVVEIIEVARFLDVQVWKNIQKTRRS
jgi:hypothetical protein